MVELTVPWEEICEDAYNRKKLKYQDLTTSAAKDGVNGFSQWKLTAEDSKPSLREEQ